MSGFSLTLLPDAFGLLVPSFTPRDEWLLTDIRPLNRRIEEIGYHIKNRLLHSRTMSTFQQDSEQFKLFGDGNIADRSVFQCIVRLQRFCKGLI